MSNIAVYPGTFDPITNGHTDLVNRGCRLFDKIIILVAEKTQKNTLFTIDESIKFVESDLETIDFKFDRENTFHTFILIMIITIKKTTYIC